MREVIAVAGLTRRFGPLVALDGVTFRIDGPQLVVILGPNGAGKTTLLDLLEGLSRADAGEVRLFAAPLDVARYPRERVGVVLQKEFILDGITVGEYAELFAAIQQVDCGERQILSQARLEARAQAPLARISHGEAQRLFIAAAAVHRPELLFLDEPTAHLDPPAKLEVARMLREMSAAQTIVMTTHDLREADAISDHVLFLVEGRVKAEGTRAALIDGLPPEARGRGTLEEAFFHYCAARLTAVGDMEPARP
jgi:ABC-2 type transport system ATP-binding protein